MRINLTIVILVLSCLIISGTTYSMEWLKSLFIAEKKINYDPVKSILDDLDTKILHRLPKDIKQLIYAEIVKKDNFCLLPTLSKKIDNLVLNTHIVPKLSKNKKFIIAGCSESISLIDLDDESVSNLRTNPQEVSMYNPFFIEDGDSLKVGYNQAGYGYFPTTHIWNGQNGKNEYFNNHLYDVTKPKISRDGCLMANRSEQGLKLLNLSAMTVSYFKLDPNDNENKFTYEPICNFTWSNSNNLIIVLIGKVQVFDVIEEKLLMNLPIDEYPEFDKEIIISDNDRYLIFRVYNNGLCLIDLQNQTQSTRECSNIPKLITHDHYLINYNEQMQKIEIFDLLNNLQRVSEIDFTFSTHNNINNENIFIPIAHTSMIAISSLGATTIHLWNYTNGEYLGGFSMQGNNRVVSIIPLSEIRLIVVGHKSMQIWELNRSLEQSMALKYLTEIKDLKIKNPGRAKEKFNYLMSSEFSEKLDKTNLQVVISIFYS